MIKDIKKLYYHLSDTDNEINNYNNYINILLNITNDNIIDVYQ